MVGRPPKPTQLKLVTGNPGKRQINRREPSPAPIETLDPPAWLPQAAKEVWEEIAPPMAATKILTEVDVQMLAMGCVAIAQHRYAVKRTGDDLVKVKHEVDDEGELFSVGEHINPWMLVQSMTFKQAMAVFQQFGMSPVARARVVVQPQSGGQDDRDSKTPRYF